MTRVEMINKGFFVLISGECFDLCEQLENETHVLRVFDTERKAKNFAKKNGYPVITE